MAVRATAAVQKAPTPKKASTVHWLWEAKTKSGELKKGKRHGCGRGFWRRHERSRGGWGLVFETPVWGLLRTRPEITCRFHTAKKPTMGGQRKSGSDFVPVPYQGLDDETQPPDRRLATRRDG